MNSSFNYMPVLETNRLRLRRIGMGDAPAIFEYSKDPRVAKYVLWDAYETVGEAREYVRYMLKKYRLQEAASWGIEWKETGKVIGTIGFMWIQEDNHAAEVGYSLSRAFWNQGIMTEALYAVLEYSFAVLHLNRVEAQFETENPASGRVMEKCGMQKEGTLRQRLYNKGRYVDVNLYSILRQEWNHRQKRF